MNVSEKYRAKGSFQFRERAFFAQLRPDDLVHYAPYNFGCLFFLTSAQFVIKRRGCFVKIAQQKLDSVEISCEFRGKVHQSKPPLNFDPRQMRRNGAAFVEILNKLTNLRDCPFHDIKKHGL